MSGWVRDLDDPSRKLDITVVLPGHGTLAQTTADRFSATLAAVGVGDGFYAFHAEFPRSLTDAERDQVQVRPAGGKSALQHAPALSCDFLPWGVDPARFQGYLDARSHHHVEGWVRNLDDAADKLALDVVLPTPSGERILTRITADRYSQALVEIGVGDGVHAFHHQFATPLTDAERDMLQVRIVTTGQAVQHAPNMRTAFEPIAHLALDIVNNCNLRCPFCVVDYTGTKATKFMTDATFQAALALIPYVTDGNFWLSCLHEATLHPRLLDFIAAVPREYRHKLYYTTNLAKRMPDAYFAAICDAGMHHLNISLESLDPPVYEKMRAGARFPIFQQNWEKLLAHHATGHAPPPLRYNIMCYRSNLHSIPALVQTLLDEKRAWQVELRHTYDVAHIPPNFRETEFLTTEEWAWLKAQLAHHDTSRVVLLMPPDDGGYDPTAITPPADPQNDDAKFASYPGDDDAAWNRAPRPFNLSMDWAGVLRVYGWKPQGDGKPDRFITYAKTNIAFLANPMAFLEAL